jgi:hypothetical protein
MLFVGGHTRDWCLRWIKELKAAYGGKKTKTATQIITLATALEAEANFLKINTRDFP